MDNDIIDAIDAALLDEDDEYDPDNDPFHWLDAARGNWQEEPREPRPPLHEFEVFEHYHDPADPPWLVTPTEPVPADWQPFVEAENPQVWEVSRQPPGCYSEDPAVGQTVVLSATLSDGLRTCYFTYIHGEDPRNGEWGGDADMLEAIRVLDSLDPPDDPLRMIAGALAAVGWWGTVSDSVWEVLAGDDN